MENINQEAPRRRPVRRKKTKWQIFKEAYLPTVILAVTAILIIWFIIGGAVRKRIYPLVKKQDDIRLDEEVAV